MVYNNPELLAIKVTYYILDVQKRSVLFFVTFNFYSKTNKKY